MKVTIFWPPTPQGRWNFRIYPSMGSAYLDAVLREKYEVSVVDANIVHGNTAEFYKDHNEIHNPSKTVLDVWNDILNKLIKITEETNPNFLCVGSWSYNMPFIAEFTRNFKARNPNIPIILGGINPTLIPNETLMTLPYIDYLVRGEGEDTIVELIDALSKQKLTNNIKGVSFWKDNKIVHTPTRQYIENLDKLPFMDYEDFIGFKEWNKEPMHFAQVMTSRGCVANCSFCTVHQIWKKQRCYSDEYVIKQIKHLFSLYDYKKNTVAFMDDNFVVSFDKTKKLVTQFHSEFPKTIFQIVDMRVDALSKGFFQFIKKNGCEFVGFGVESINSESLKFMNKTINPERYKKTVFKLLATAEKLEIRTMLSSIIGTPNETRKEMIEQANFYVNVYNKYKQSYFDVTPLVVHPKTDLWHKYLEGKLTLYKRPPHSAKRFYEGMYADKWDHLLFMVPNAYRVKNTKIQKEEFEKLLRYLVKEKLIPLAIEAKNNLEREKTCHIEDQ